MTTDLSRASLPSIRRATALPVVHWGLGAAAVAAGGAGVHFAFGLLLISWVAWSLVRIRDVAPLDDEARLRLFVRRQSRVVYLVLYGVLLLRLVGAALSVSWHGGAAWSYSQPLLADPALTFRECGERFRVDLCSGVIALCLMRALAAYRLRASACAQPLNQRPKE